MRSRKHGIGIGLALLVAVATTVPALAQPASGGVQPYPSACKPESVPGSVSDTAHAIYQAGKAYYDDANYESAIQQFREAYKKDCSKHDLLIIISRAYELKGDRAAAINALETYLERVPTSPDAPTHKTHIENLRKQLLAQPAPSATVTPPPKPVEMREHTIPPWLVVAAGGVAIVAGIVVLATTPSLPSNCMGATKKCSKLPSESDATFTENQNDAGRSQTQPVIGAIVLGGGAVIVGAGLLWHFLEPTGPVESSGQAKPKLTPQVAPGFAGLSLGGSF